MRVGIVTIHHVTNYGAVLQAYALSQALARRGADVEIIDYRPTAAVDWYRQALWKNGRPNLRRHLWSRTFDRFVDRRLPLGPVRYDDADSLAAAALDYDVLVAGSDQIWCTGDGSFRGFDPVFFLDFCCDPAVAKFSYAASAGNTTDFAEHGERVRASLGEFAGLAVRDDRTAELVAETTGRTPTVVLDPVFLHDFEELTGDVEPGRELVIFSTRPERFAGIAGPLARRHGLKVVSLLRPFAGADECPRVVGPADWLRRMKGARAVLTDYFHGVAIALKFGRPVLADAAPGKMNKIADLTGRLQVSDLLMPTSGDPVAAIEAVVAEPDEFSDVLKSRLAEPMERSCAFLDSIFATSAVGAA